MAEERWEAIKAKVIELGRAHVRAGVVGSAANEPHGDSGLTNGEMALLHEFGNIESGGHIKQRSFVRSTLRDAAVRSAFGRLQAGLVKQVIAGRMSRDHALREMGEWMAARIKERILNHEIRPEDAPATVAAKGHSVPLLESGQLAESVGFEVVK